ncbi:MAG: cell wall-binding repeat-containing protein [Ruminococcus sp.]|nr:cell wall-binding repeat-containing protein [Ruminococcus sp.]
MKRIKTKAFSFITAFLMVFTLVSLIPEGTITASALETYNLYVFGTQVTNKNAADILGDGAASYDAKSKTLTIKKDIKGTDYIIKNCIKGLTIKTTKALTIESTNYPGLYLIDDTTIQTSGKLTIKTAKGCGAISCSLVGDYRSVITIKDSDIEANASSGLYGFFNDSTLNIINSNIKMTATNNDKGSLSGFNKGVFLTNCFVKTPADAVLECGGLYAANSATTEPVKSFEICRGRLAGQNRYATAAVISQTSFDKTANVVLASGANYADALAGVPLARKLEAPILLTTPNALSAETLAEINRLGAKNVTILGGEGAVSKNVENALIAKGCKVNRIHGKSRFGTAADIAEKTNAAPSALFFVYGLDYADALSVSHIAARKGVPIIYLTKGGEMNAETAQYLAVLKKKGCVKTAYFVGGEGAISDFMMQKAANALNITDKKQKIRISGADRYETCLNVNAKFFDEVSNSMICVATGLDFPDALAGGVFAAKYAAPLILVNGNASLGLSGDQREYISDKAPNGIAIFGGTGAVSDRTVKEICDLIR